MSYNKSKDTYKQGKEKSAKEGFEQILQREIGKVIKNDE